MDNYQLISYTKGLMNLASSLSKNIGPSYVTVKYFTKKEFENLVSRKKINIYDSNKSLKEVLNAWFNDDQIVDSIIYWLEIHLENPVNIYQSNSDFHDTLMEQELTPFSFIEDVYLVEYKNFIMCLIMGNNE